MFKKVFFCESNFLNKKIDSKLLNKESRFLCEFFIFSPRLRFIKVSENTEALIEVHDNPGMW